MAAVEALAASEAATLPGESAGGVDLREIAALLDQLKDESPEKREAAHASLPRIAAALGPARARDELVPFVCDLTDDADRVLLELAAQLANLTNEVGGPRHARRPGGTHTALQGVFVRSVWGGRVPGRLGDIAANFESGPGTAQAHVLLEPLEALCAVEDGRVRGVAVASAVGVCGALPPDSVAAHYVPFAARLGRHDWFTARVDGRGGNQPSRCIFFVGTRRGDSLSGDYSAETGSRGYSAETGSRR